MNFKTRTTMTKIMRLVVDYCNENVYEYEERVQMALDKIDHYRAPLSQVDSALYNEIQDAICDCALDYEFDADDVDVEEVIWAE